jgi:enamine deaminase RidA (YjgF/YER057c/UK114 family)
MPTLVTISRPVVLMTVLAAASLQAAEIKRVRDTDGKVVAVRVSGAALAHTGQLVPREIETDAGEEEQVSQVLARLAETLAQNGSERSDVVKLNVYVRDAAMRALCAQQLDDWFGSDAPAVAYVASPLPNSAAAIGLDAVVATDPANFSRVTLDHISGNKNASSAKGRQADFAVLPLGDVVYISGQAAAGELRAATRETMAGLFRTIDHLGLKKSDVVQVKCFVKPVSDVAIADEEIARAFEGTFAGGTTPPVVHVEWTSASRAIEIEVIVAAGKVESADTVSYVTPPWMKSSPVFSRAARIHGNERIYIAGLYPKDADDGAAQVKSIFAQLTSALEGSGTDVKHLAKATYYVSCDDASAQLNQLRPSYYDPQRPPAASKAAVQSVAADGCGITIDMIAAPVSGE